MSKNSSISSSETAPPPHLDLATLRALGAAAPAQDCEACVPLRQPGWESLPAGFDHRSLLCIGNLATPARDGDEENATEPTTREYHPQGTHLWSERAPIAPRHAPYNRSQLWQSRCCGRLFLRYTEYGGYYQDERIRWFDPGLLVDDGC
ncbi:hypothetical protein G8A07_15150 [Roseateles sp. DAIF2]|uniref:hypothetical protein n=1 Tax=Roseateles sp. DAIF2 TaxID=2714952 RepID=UPI0018A2A1B1|nr:hypothetical protein [Roseateles sp. DAIF2]QPF74118.1 hypothetical protein G8A07_15150 [Roseateles sp. DAIF2]